MIQSTRSLNKKLGATSSTLTLSKLSEKNQQELQAELQTLRQMIEFLVQYEQQCINNVDLSNAKQSREKLKNYMSKQDELVKQIIKIKQQKKIHQSTSKHQITMMSFDQHWSQYISTLMTQFAQAENKLKKNQEHERNSLIEKYEGEKQNFKQSVKLTLVMQKVINLMKMHEYQKAEDEQEKAKSMMNEETKLWQENIETSKKRALNVLTKKHNKQFNLLRSKNQATLHKKLKERDSKFELMIKKKEKEQKQLKKNSKELTKNFSSISLSSMRFLH